MKVFIVQFCDFIIASWDVNVTKGFDMDTLAEDLTS